MFVHFLLCFAMQRRIVQLLTELRTGVIFNKLHLLGLKQIENIALLKYTRSARKTCFFLLRVFCTLPMPCFSIRAIRSASVSSCGGLVCPSTISIADGWNWEPCSYTGISCTHKTGLLGNVPHRQQNLSFQEWCI